jgi:acetyl-CoA carboxylase biotin carboxyl carrier protein
MTDIPARDIEALIKIFDQSNWDELRVVADGIEIYLSKKVQDGLPATTLASVTSRETKPMAASPAIPSAAKGAAAATIPEGMIAVRAPNLGTFYRAPKPGALPYVAIGQIVEPATEICLIEVMKLFTAVCAGVAGTVREVLAEDSQLVQFDQPLFLIEPLA